MNSIIYRILDRTILHNSTRHLDRGLSTSLAAPRARARARLARARVLLARARVLLAGARVLLARARVRVTGAAR